MRHRTLMQPNGYTTLWDVAKVAFFSELWEGSELSIAEIAEELSARWGITITPHSLHNKAHRLRLKRRSRVLGSIWNDERWARLQELWGEEDPLPFSQMSDLLTWEWGIKVSKNALISRCNRMGLLRKPKFIPPVPPSADFLPGHGECSYPFFDPDHPDFHYCKAPTHGHTYCDWHRALCYLKPKKREEERIAA